ncbi:MAG: MMPL family transporter [Candidatus Omnitrophica bacterium]|nr:MMPL family transporter [Candidatus Omnitrophota bacterium]
MFERMVNFALRKPKIIFGVSLLLTILACLQFLKIKIDTDPENMLSEKEFVRVFHKEVKKEFSLHDYIVLGVVDEQNEQGVFNPSTLEKVYGITRKIKNIDGVAAYELMSLGNKDDIQQAGPGEVSFSWLMGKPPYSSEEAARIRERALANPLFYNTLISQDAKALCIYVPIREKNLSYRVSLAIQGILKQYGGEEERYYLAGLPLAEDAFGKEMFVQMGICAPLAILVIFLLMYWFFRNFILVLVPILMAADVVLLTMGLMVGLGFPIHIMSSMIPIFLLPICVLDSIHILSDFFEEYKKTHDKNKTVSGVLKTLFIPNLFTSITTIAGFFSLSFAPIPPIQVFGIFVAAGVAIAWFTTVLFIPAYVAVLKEKHLEGFGATHEELSAGLLSRFLVGMGRLTVRRWKIFLLLTVAVAALSVYGITRIRVNDNPTKWFARRHPIRIADTVLNRHFGGTYSVYFILEAQDKEGQVFKEPAMLSYIKKMQDYLYSRGQVSKSTSLADVVMKVYCELMGRRKTYYAIPKTRPAVAQCLLSFENSHKPDDLFHFVTPDYSKANLWLQLKSGDNQVMAQVKRDTERFIKNNPPPYPVTHNFSGLTYINMVWQDKMVVGMLWNFIGSFIIVLFMMIMLLRSVLAALVCMVPLTITVLFIYGSLGLTGKEYDMPVAVLSALTLGLAVDFAIHFTERAKAIYAVKGNWKDTSEEMFLTPYRAILRNALVVSIGFLPLFISPLVPYNTVGLFMLAIMLFASAGTLVILPAIVSMHPGVIFYEPKPGFLRSCPQCLLMSLVISGGVAYLLVAYTATAWNVATIIALASVILLSVLCSFISRMRGCLFLRKPNREG